MNFLFCFFFLFIFHEIGIKNPHSDLLGEVFCSGIFCFGRVLLLFSLFSSVISTV